MVSKGFKKILFIIGMSTFSQISNQTDFTRSEINDYICIPDVTKFCIYFFGQLF